MLWFRCVICLVGSRLSAGERECKDLLAIDVAFVEVRHVLRHIGAHVGLAQIQLQSLDKDGSDRARHGAGHTSAVHLVFTLFHGVGVRERTRFPSLFSMRKWGLIYSEAVWAPPQLAQTGWSAVHSLCLCRSPHFLHFCTSVQSFARCTKPWQL